MPENFDIAVIGAGPSGLSAARTAARLGLDTVLLEKNLHPAVRARPRFTRIHPIPGYFSGYRLSGWLHFPELELIIPPRMVYDNASYLCFLSPAGYELQIEAAPDNRFPVALIDKTALLIDLAIEAAAAGADLRFSTPATQLISHSEKIAGVQTHWQDIYAKIVISAEGPSRRFCELAGLYDAILPAGQSLFIITEDLQAPHAGLAHLGQIVTLGRRYCSLPRASGSLIITAPGQAQVRLQTVQNNQSLTALLPLSQYLEELKINDPRFRQILPGAQGKGQLTSCLTLRQPPTHLIRPGFIGCGSAVSTTGEFGLLPSIYTGVLAARAAAECLSKPSQRLRALGDYNQRVSRGLRRFQQAESWLAARLSRLEDEQIDRLFQMLRDFDLAPLLYGQPGRFSRGVSRDLVRLLPGFLKDWRLLMGILSTSRLVY